MHLQMGRQLCMKQVSFKIELNLRSSARGKERLVQFWERRKKSFWTRLLPLPQLYKVVRGGSAVRICTARTNPNESFYQNSLSWCLLHFLCCNYNIYLTKRQFHILNLKSFGSALSQPHALRIQNSYTRRRIKNRAQFIFPYLVITNLSTTEIKGLFLLKCRNALCFIVSRDLQCLGPCATSVITLGVWRRGRGSVSSWFY